MSAASSLRQSSKRMRADEEPATDIKKHTRHWFAQGDVVLLAKDDVVGFRLHHDVLSMQSEIFKDILSLPSHAQENERIQGCSVVHLQDSSEDLETLFDIFYDGETQRRFYHPKQGMVFRCLYGVVTLSYKYEIKHIQTAAVAKLELAFPTTLNRHDVKFYLEWNKCDYGDDGACIALVNLARRFNLTQFLPVALFTCIKSRYFGCLLESEEYQSGHKEQLSQDDLRRCLGAVTEFDAVLLSRIDIFLRFQSDVGCVRLTGACAQAACSLFKYLATYTDFMAKGSTFRPLDKDIDEALSPTKEQPCGPCLKRLLSEYNDLRKTLWDRLPAIFDLR